MGHFICALSLDIFNSHPIYSAHYIMMWAKSLAFATSRTPLYGGQILKIKPCKSYKFGWLILLYACRSSENASYFKSYQIYTIQWKSSGPSLQILFAYLIRGFLCLFKYSTGPPIWLERGSFFQLKKFQSFYPLLSCTRVRLLRIMRKSQITKSYFLFS